MQPLATSNPKKTNPTNQTIWIAQGGTFNEADGKDWDNAYEVRNQFVKDLNSTYQKLAESIKPENVNAWRGTGKGGPFDITSRRSKNVALMWITDKNAGTKEQLMAISGVDKPEHAKVCGEDYAYTLVRSQKPYPYKTKVLKTDGEKQDRARDTEAKLLGYLALAGGRSSGKWYGELSRTAASDHEQVLKGGGPKAALFNYLNLDKPIPKEQEGASSSPVSEAPHGNAPSSIGGVPASVENDPSAKLLVDLLKRPLDLSNKEYQIHLHSKYPVCASCEGVFKQFTEEFQNVKITVTAGKERYEKTSSQPATVATTDGASEAGRIPSAAGIRVSNSEARTEQQLLDKIKAASSTALVGENKKKRGAKKNPEARPSLTAKEQKPADETGTGDWQTVVSRRNRKGRR